MLEIPTEPSKFRKDSTHAPQEQNGFTQENHKERCHAPPIIAPNLGEPFSIKGQNVETSFFGWGLISRPIDDQVDEFFCPAPPIPRRSQRLMSDDFPAFTPQHFSALAASLSGDRPPSPNSSPLSSRASRDGESFVNVSPAVAGVDFSGGVRLSSSTNTAFEARELDTITGRLSSLSRSLMAIDDDPEVGLTETELRDFNLRKPSPLNSSDSKPFASIPGHQASTSPPPTFDSLPQRARLLDLLSKKPPRVGACRLFRFDGNPETICGGRVGKDDAGMCVKPRHL